MDRTKFTIKREEKKKKKWSKNSSESPHHRLGYVAHVTIPHITEVLIAIQYIALH